MSVPSDGPAEARRDARKGEVRLSLRSYAGPVTLATSPQQPADPERPGGQPSAGLPPAGWYGDPSDVHALRWWSGAGWTGYTYPLQAAQPRGRSGRRASGSVASAGGSSSPPAPSSGCGCSGSACCSTRSRRTRRTTHRPCCRRTF
ncbi:DUF2510 domain-containing protein [Leifsonia sp. L25]|uniref:DUF2510 domain-containing protein n=1 Tax=Leifsonia sp. L25 TaxID=3423957 RepID=UPI003D683C4A